MYKLVKLFTAKEKQIAKEREKEAGASLTSGIKQDALDADFAPLSIANTIQGNIKQFKVE